MTAPAPKPKAAPASGGAKPRQVLLSLLPLLILFAGASTFFMFKWKRDYVRVARKLKGADLALSHLERCREILDRIRKFQRLPGPDAVRLEDLHGLSEEALHAAATAQELHPDSEEAYRLHGQALEGLYNFEEARASYKEAGARHGESPARYHLGLLNARILARARLAGLKTSLVAEEAMELDASEPLRRYMAPAAEFRVKIDQKVYSTAVLGVLYAAKDWPALLSSSNVAETGDPTEWLPPYFRGLALLGLDQPEQALKSFEAAVRLAPALPDAHAWSAVILQKLKRRAEAVQALTSALELSEHFLEAWYLRGLLLFDEGRFAEARQDFENCLKLRPSLPEARLKLGVSALEAWHRGGRKDAPALDAAVDAFTQVLAARPADAAVLLLRARARVAKSDWDAAETDLAAAIAAAPSSLDALALRAQAREARGAWDPALQDLEALLAKSPDAASAAAHRRSRARIRAAAGRIDEALADLDAMLASDPNDLGVHLDKTSLLEKAGRADQALAAADRVLEISRTHPRARAARARLLLAKGDAPSAIEEAGLAIRADPQLAEAYVVRGHAFRKQGINRRAEEDWTRALEIRPDLRAELEGPLRDLKRDP